MTQKFSERRRAAFLAGLSETGNHTLAARRAKVSRSWVTLHKSTDPAFRAACDAAVAGFCASLGERADGTVPAAGWRSADGVQLVVRGSNGRRCQVARSRLKQWDAAAEGAFLRTLMVTANVKAACLAAGLTPASAYAHRKRHPHFRARWDAALIEGYSEVEAMVIERARRSVGAAADLPDMPDAPPPLNFDEAMQVLRLHMKAVRGVGNAPGRQTAIRRQSLEELREGIIAKINMVLRQSGKPPLSGSPPDPAWRGRGGG